MNKGKTCAEPVLTVLLHPNWVFSDPRVAAWRCVAGGWERHMVQVYGGDEVTYEAAIASCKAWAACSGCPDMPDWLALTAVEGLCNIRVDPSIPTTQRHPYSLRVPTAGGLTQW